MIMGGSSGQTADAGLPPESMRTINTELQHAGSPFLLTEKILERYWVRALEFNNDRQSDWLLLVRLAEAALICAGNYADNCEFRSAGDFLVNPREIVIHRRDGLCAMTKRRHGRLSDQLGREWTGCVEKKKRSSAGDVDLEITKLPLLPHMTQILKQSGRVAPAFLQRLEEGQRRIADALAFLAAWRVFDSAELWKRLKASPPHERVFAESHLCRFDMQTFDRIGADLLQSLRDPGGHSPFLSRPWRRGIQQNRKAPLRLLAQPA